MSRNVEQEKQVTLGMTDGTRNIDKVFELYLIKHHSDTGFVVLSKYGKRNGGRTTHVKTKDPVAYSKASGIFANLLEDKLRKGYEYE